MDGARWNKGQKEDSKRLGEPCTNGGVRPMGAGRDGLWLEVWDLIVGSKPGVCGVGKDSSWLAVSE